MDRYYSDSDDKYNASRRRPDNVYASGWQSPVPAADQIASSSIIRIVAECPFGQKKCDYTIDKSQRGRLIVTARRRHKLKSDYFLSSNKNDLVTQTFTIPYDADVDNIKSHVEPYSNNLIIEIPHSSTHVVHSNDLRTSSSGAPHIIQNENNRKLEYRIDCNGYRADELEVFIENQDIVVQGKTRRRSSSIDSKEFSRRISLPSTVDISKIVSFFENDELRIEAPLKREVYYNHDRIILPESLATPVGFQRIQSPIPSNRHHHYRRNERFHRRSISPMRRVVSAENIDYPYYREFQDWDYDDDGDDEDDAVDRRHRRAVNYRRHTSNHRGVREPMMYRPVYSPTNHFRRPTKSSRYYPIVENVYYRY